MRKDDLNSFIKTAPYRYRSYRIPKRNNRGWRIIAQPTKEVKLLQRLAIKKLHPKLRIHSSCMAYEKGRSIKKNALIHVDNPYLLKLDFARFFPSIKPDDFLQCLNNQDIELSDEPSFIANLFFWKPRKNSGLVLSIGAPSSPIISNAVMYHFDITMKEYSQENDLLYSRYADDLTFSTEKRKNLLVIQQFVGTELRKLSFPRLCINKSKTVFLSKAGNRRVTGITLTNDNKISLGRYRKRLISCMVHKHKYSQLTTEDISRLRGYISFALDIEPSFVESLKVKYGNRVIMNILEFN